MYSPNNNISFTPVQSESMTCYLLQNCVRTEASAKLVYRIQWADKNVCRCKNETRQAMSSYPGRSVWFYLQCKGEGRCVCSGCWSPCRCARASCRGVYRATCRRWCFSKSCCPPQSCHPQSCHPQSCCLTGNIRCHIDTMAVQKSKIGRQRSRRIWTVV